ncbi:MAG TPA: lipocalin-like domain-containing protein [Vicinamibacteria bacterium]|nr:lipocalin-like domain-containing protein [Vicinamibacteria bacterium]
MSKKRTSRATKPLVGTWRLTAMEVRTASGETKYPWGRAVGGRLTYSSNGQMSVQIMKANRLNFSSEDLEGGTAEEIQAAFDGYHAYFGTYSYDGRARTVIHRVEGSLFPNWIGHQQTRSVKVSARRLTLTSSPILFGGQEEVFVAVWDRIR